MASVRPLYRSLVGKLLYLSVVSRPDLSFVVSNLGQFLSNPGKAHWLGAKRVLRYLKDCSDYRLVYHSRDSAGELVLSGYSDSDWGSDLDDRRSVSGYLFSLGSGVIRWKSKKQPTVALSSAEAEYLGLSSSAQEAMFLRSLLAGLGITDLPVTTIYGYNQASLALAENPRNHGRAKHIDIRYHYLRDLVAEQHVAVLYVGTGENVADLMTKNLPSSSTKFVYFRQQMSGHDIRR